MYSRVIRYRWLLGHEGQATRLTDVLVATAANAPDLLATRVLRALDGGNEGLVVFEWASREALNRHRATASIELSAPWAVPLLHWRTDQSYAREATGEPPRAAR